MKRMITELLTGVAVVGMCTAFVLFAAEHFRMLF